MKELVKTLYIDAPNTEGVVRYIKRILRRLLALNPQTIGSHYISAALELVLYSFFYISLIVTVRIIPVVLTNLLGFTLIYLTKLRLDIAISIVSSLSSLDILFGFNGFGILSASSNYNILNALKNSECVLKITGR